jgi:hypothetical protein
MYDNSRTSKDVRLLLFFNEEAADPSHLLPPHSSKHDQK